MAREEKKNETERVRKLVGFKTFLEKKIRDAEAELQSLKTLLEFVHETLLERGFKTADVAKPKLTKTTALPPVMEYEKVVPLKTVTGDLLANLYVSQNSMRVTIAEDKVFSVETPPFQQFLIERVLNKMREKDSEAASKGETPKNKVFSYDLVSDGDIIREIVIKNLTADRKRELKSSIHWTLEKMYEKAKKDV